MGDGNASAKERLEKESLALKDAVYGFIRDGLLDAAGSVLAAYAQAAPADPDIFYIKNMIDLAASENETPEGLASGTKLRDKLKLLNGIETIFILTNTNLERNGAVNSVIRKVKLMEEMWGYRPLILFCEHNVELRRIVKRLREDGNERHIRLGAYSRVLNVYDYFQGSYAAGLPNKALFLNDDGVNRVQTNEDVYDIYEGGVLARREYYIGYAYSLRLIEYFKDGKLEKGVYYDDWGYLNKVREYDSTGEKRYPLERFYDTGGRLRIEAFYEFKDGENQVYKVILYDENGGVKKECGGNAELAKLCLDELTSDGSKTYLLAVENGMMAGAAMVGKPNVRRAAVVHSAFLEDSYDLSSVPQPFYSYICENRDKFGAIIFPTRSERDDFRAKYGSGFAALHVIPHPYPYPAVETDFDERNHRKAVIVARFDAIKRIDEAIQIFKLVVSELPDVKLEIYGAGSQVDRYGELIKSLGLEGNVFIMGFTDDPASVFRGAAVSLMTSAAEGFGLTLAESVCNGCPAFAFDVKYGPSDIIRDGETGFLILRFDKEGFASKLISYFNDIELQRALSENCRKDAGRFDQEAFLERWYNIVYNMFYNTSYSITPAPGGARPLLSVGMIVKNEGKTLRACLNGIKPILEQIDSELIIADTGSSDGTTEIAREFTDKVYKIEWENDFSQARNTTLERANGKWYMFLDADETFTDTADIIEFFNSGEYKKYGSASHLRREAGLGRDSVVTRLFKRNKDTAFTGRIHENIPAREPVKRLESLSVHTGYAYEGDEGKRRAKYERNLAPLMETYREDPTDLRTITQIAAEHVLNGNGGEAGRFIEAGLSLSVNEPGDVYRHALTRLNVVMLAGSGQSEKAVDEIRRHFERPGRLYSMAVDLRLIEARALADLGRRREAIEAYAETIRLFKDYQAGKLDNTDVDYALTAAPAPETEAAAAMGIASQYSELGDAERALEWIRKYRELGGVQG